MLVLVKSGPETLEGRRAVRLAAEMAADLCLIQNAVYFAQKDMLQGFCGRAYVLDEDVRMRGIGHEAMEKAVMSINYDELSDLLYNEAQVVGHSEHSLRYACLVRSICVSSHMRC